MSATDDRVPVPVYLHYLFPYYTSLDSAREKANGFVGPGASLRRVCFLGPDRRFFEFEGPGGRVFLHASPLSPRADEEVARLKTAATPPAGGARRAPDERRQKVRAQLRADWDASIAEVGGK